MKKTFEKGFTLVELLAVLAILAIVIALVATAVIKTLNNSKQNAYDLQVLNIESAASQYVTDNKNNIVELSTVSGRYEILLKDLSDAGYVETPIKNPLTNEYFDEEDVVVLVIRESLTKYTYDFYESVSAILSPPAIPGAFTAPTGTVYRNQTNTVTWGATPSWGSPTTDSNYRLEVQYDAGAWTLVANTGTTASRNHTLAATGNSVRYRVNATSGGGTSNWIYSNTLTLTTPAWILVGDNIASRNYEGCDTRKDRLQIGTSSGWVVGVGFIRVDATGCSNVAGSSLWLGNVHDFEWRVTFQSGQASSVIGSNATLRAEWPFTKLYDYDPQFTVAGQSFIFDTTRHLLGSQLSISPDEGTYGIAYFRVERRQKIN